MKKNAKKSTVSWLMEWATPYQTTYILSVLLAILGVLCGILPYYALTKIITGLLNFHKNTSYYVFWILMSAFLWILRYVFHGLSSSCSHKATFQVIARVRKMLTAKLVRFPMGYLLDTPSGTIKNIIVEKVDSIRPPLHHYLSVCNGLENGSYFTYHLTARTFLLYGYDERL